jgi:hypothetical protein
MNKNSPDFKKQISSINTFLGRAQKHASFDNKLSLKKNTIVLPSLKTKKDLRWRIIG